MTEWYFSHVGLQQGPVVEAELRQKIQRGEIGEANFVWREGMTDWLPVAQVPEFRGLVAVEGLLVEEAGREILVPQPPPFQGGPQVFQIQSHLVASIVALVLSCGMGFLICLPIALPFAIVAIVYAAKVDGLIASGDILGAQTASKAAKKWVNISVFSWLGLHSNLCNRRFCKHRCRRQFLAGMYA